MQQDDKLLKLAKKYKVGQTVFVYVEPRHSTSPETSPIWQGELEQVSAVRKITFGKDDSDDLSIKKESIEFTLSVAFLLQTREYSEEDVFFSLEEAKAHAREQFAGIYNRRDIFLKNLKSASAELEAQVIEDD